MGAALDAMGEQRLEGRLVDRGGAKDTGARSRAADFGNREPVFARQRRGGIEPKAAPAGGKPIGAFATPAFGEAVGKGQSDARPHLVRPERSRGAFPGLSASAPRLRSGRTSQLEPTPCQTSRRLGSSTAFVAPASQPELQVRIVAAEAAFGQDRKSTR